MPTTYAIPNGRTAMDATTYTSNGTTQTVSNADLGTVGFKPDLLWIKNRSITQNNYLSDSNRGVANTLSSNTQTAESNSPNFITSFNTNGFSFGVDNTANGNSMVGWQWVAGQGVNNTNTNGTITSTVSANTTNGFSIVTYTGTGANATVGHSLSAIPSVIMLKQRSAGVSDWRVYFSVLGNTGAMILNDITAFVTDSTYWNNTTPTSSVFSLGTNGNNNGSGRTYVAYCWAPVAGFSQFGSYTGNGSNDGPFIYTGFRPKFYLFKRSDSAGNWYILDTSRGTYNFNTPYTFPNRSDAETTGTNIVDILSNGIKIRSNASIDWNATGGTYIYMAFAENPFKYANAR